MGQKSKIEWTDATWNPTTGCTKLTAGCDNCYAHTLAHGRLSDIYARRLPVVDTPETRADPFAVRLWDSRLGEPAKWRSPRMVFVNSMSDLFHVNVPDEFTRRIFEVMLRVDRHTYQVLTKRPARMARFVRLNADLFPGGEVPAHIWMGTSIEDDRVLFRADHLRDVPAAVRFLSCEPLLGSLAGLALHGIHWVIAGGESGIGYRKMDSRWVRALRDLCVGEDVAFFFKQWGGRTPRAGGRELDGETWDQLPCIAPVVAHS
jgi:protein gp37